MLPFMAKMLPGAALSAAACALLCSCATHETESRKMRESFYAGNYAAAASEASSIASSKSGSGDELVWRLESGAASRWAGDAEGSAREFSRAFSLVEGFDASPEVSISDEAGALMTNQSYLPYRAYSYDRIMMGCYQALNCMSMGDMEGASVALKRVENFQADAERRNADRIEKSLKNASSYSGRTVEGADGDGASLYDASRAYGDVSFASSLRSVYGAGAADVPKSRSQLAESLRGIYVNPFAYWLDGLFYMANASDLSEASRAADDFRLALEMQPSNPYLAEDLRAAENFASTGRMSPVTYVIFETGCAPIRSQTRIDIPMFAATKDVPYVGVSFPVLAYSQAYEPRLSVLSSGVFYVPQPLADMDAIITREFNSDLPVVVAKTLLSAGTKAAIQFGIQEAARQADNSALLIAAMISGSVYQAAMNDADLRTWTTLPKAVSYSRFPTPANRKILVDSNIEVELDDALINVVCVRRTFPGTPLSVLKFSMRKEEKK